MAITYNSGKVKPIVQVVANLLKKDPTLHEDHERLWATVCVNIPQLKDHKRCPNCSASMVQYEYNIDVLDIALVVAMAKRVKENMQNPEGEQLSFGEANRIHVPTLDVSDAVRHRTTKCSKLGLIAKYKEGGSQINGTWLVTARGFKALRGEEIPTGTVVWRGQILDRPETVTTFDSVRATYIKRIERFERTKHKAPKDDHRGVMGTYNETEWVDFAGVHKGELF